MQEVQASPATTTNAAQPVYATLLGRNPRNPLPNQEAILVDYVLPRPGEYGEQRIILEDEKGALIAEYTHFAFRFHPKGPVINVQVYGEVPVIERLAESGRPARCELEIVSKTVGEREFILVNLYLTNPNRRATHDFGFTSKSPKQIVYGEFTTPHMKGMTVGVFPRRISR